MPTAAQINALLPQTQCRECGFSGCLPYAQAIARREAPINLCAPGGAIVIHDLAQLLGQPEIAPAKSQTPALAWIDEAICIGCTACIRACPVDAIMGASKQMHTVLADECTGCGLCVAPCPVDCIYMQPTTARHLPQARVLTTNAHAAERFQAAQHAQARYENQIARKQRLEAERKQKAAAYQAQFATPIPRQPENECNEFRRSQNEQSEFRRSQNEFQRNQNECNELQHNSPNQPSTSQPPTPTPSLNPADLIAQAMQRAQKQSNERIVPSNHNDFRQNQIREAQQRATYRRYQRDAQYGTPAEKAAAIEWLRQYKLEQEAREAAKQ
ncbi:RnfABCDGE type electron transport complex subunit B [Kingella sp. (in: b-proteobacteria)]|uniref:RnfABCDGE type electron transport complex subunit B n=1 Tax=Kingella sp. (in: b-proteobacteria) TaxID=2020713 RepID=UPI0026DA9F80|nr:RnfABCDGE type electron transport complex subunit B [Kingella sp. (in: b-proteobacteria)]MDO4657381.1 RnfABCDGE type electron transport complex subunit B [Kingella sp. (in: b-proteobacteria)]